MLQATARAFVLFFIIFFNVSNSAEAQSNSMGSATLISPVISCGATTGQTIYNATSDGPASTCAGTTNDVWYTFTTPANVTNMQIDVTVGGGSNLNSTNTFIEVFDARSTAAVTVPNTLGCNDIGAGLSLSGLAPSTLYYLRIFTSATPTSTPSSKWTFSICLSYLPPPANNNCGGATTLTSATSCSNTSGTVVNASASTGLPVGCEVAGIHYDVWYNFVAASSTHTVAISGLGTSFTNSEIQLYSSVCGSLVSMGCGTVSLTSSLLRIGSTYYIRVSNIGSSPSGNGGFNICVTHPVPPVTVAAGRMNEVYKQTILSGSGVLSYPWEIAYGPDDKLWLNEARGYKVYRMDPVTGTKTTVLDLSQGSTWLPSPADSLNVQFSSSQSPWPQGGLAGLAIHPNFLDGTGTNDYVYVSYVHRYLGGSSPTGRFFRNKLVRFTYNSGTGRLESPAVLCDTLPGSSDHNSQRIIIAPSTAGGPNYIFYASGDMGAGQFDNRTRPIKAQNPDSYEGKILRFNLVSDGDAGAAAWIPNDNPYSSTSAVWSIGLRNNQGFAYDATLNILYGSSHGAYSDDEINIIEPFKNYGHPLIQGFADGNYNGNSVQGTSTSISAGAPWTDNSGVSSCPPIGNEATNKATIDAGGNGLFKAPLFSAYAASQAVVTNIWQTNPGNALPAPGWPTEAWAGLDLYTHTLIPGWKNSLVAASLKWGRLLRLRLNATGVQTAPANSVSDTVSYFGSQNRFRDLAFSPDGKDIFVIMDNSSTTSGPGSANPVVPNCAGCVQKYTFLGYYHNSSTNRSTIASSIDITGGTANTVTNGTTVTIDANNNTLWVPITGPDGNIMAEIKANGNNLGTITSTFYTHSGTVREDASKKLYLNRSITIIPQNQPTSTVNVRLYVTGTELASLITATNTQGQGSGVTSISNIKILKNNDASPEALTAATSTLTPVYAEAHLGTDNGGYVLQADITSFSSFYFANPDMITLPLELLTFKGALKANAAFLQWTTSNEINTSHFEVERSTNGQGFEKIGTVSARNTSAKYFYTDNDADKQSTSIIYYRLKMADRDGTFTYSNIISLTINDSKPAVIVYPNPVSDVLNLRISLATSELIQIQVIDMQGKVIYRKTKLVRNGRNEININTKSWPAQSYSVIVVDRNNKVLITKKLVKM